MKKRIIAIGLLLGLMASVLAMPAVAEENSMIIDGSFDRRLNQWQTWSQDTAATTFQAVKDGGPDGSPCLKITNTKPVAASVFQYVRCQPGHTYLMTCDVKCEDVGSEGSGFCLGLANYEGSNNIGEGISSSLFGSSEWRTVSYIFKINDKATSVTVGPRLWFSTGTVYVDNVTLVELVEQPAVSATYDLTLSDTANRHTVNALGCEWDPKLLLDVNQKRGITEEDLAFIKGRMETLGIQAVRMMVMPDWFEKQNDNNDPAVADPDGFSFDNQEMQCLFAYLKVCQELGVRVTLTWWGAPAGYWMACQDIGDWIGAPNSLDEMAENIVYLLKYIRDDLGYDCVKELILQNEPSYSFHVSGGAVDFDYYVAYYRTVHDRLVEAGLGDIVMVGSDDSQQYGWYYKSYEALKDICGKFNSHNYAWSYDLPSLDVIAQSFVADRTSISGDTPFYLGEFGDGSTQGAYVAGSTETYGRGLYVASIVVNAFKAGAAGASYWPLHDVYYYEGDPNGADNGGLMSMGLMGYKTDGAWSYRPTYYAYGLLCNYMPFGSQVYNITGDTDHYIDAVAVRTTTGRWSLVAVNRSGAEQTVRVSVDPETLSTALNAYLFTEEALPTDGSMIAAGGRVEPADGVYTFTLPAYSFVVLSNIHMTEEEMSVETETETATETETDVGTEAPTDPATTDSETLANDGTADETTAGTTDTASSGGCQSTLSAGVGLLALTAAVPLAMRRKKKDCR